tara:strand:- start:282 stop:548 length:267 start_codon:yes stop_codon:yes gene_type:complete
MQLGDKKLNNIIIRINKEFSLSISDLGRGSDDILEGLLVCNKTNEFKGGTFYFKSLDTLNEVITKYKQKIKSKCKELEPLQSLSGQIN